MLKELDELLIKAEPNSAHKVLAEMEKEGYLKGIITQNVDNLHQKAGSQRVVDFHGNAFRIRYLNCDRVYKRDEVNLNQAVPKCACGGLLKPDIVFFGEQIPQTALLEAKEMTNACDVMLIIGTSGEVAPANILPFEAKQHGVKIIEINITKSAYTEAITDIFLQGKASEVLTALGRELKIKGGI